MDRGTRLKVVIITIVGVLVTFVYINRGRLIREFKFAQSEREWEKEEPKGQLIGGRKNGEWTTYFKNGQLAQLENYKSDTLHGKQIHYTPDGHYKSRANYSMGVMVDSFFMYDGKGRLNLEEFRDSTGKQQGIFNVYDTEGQKIQIGSYKDGKFDGEFKSFFKTGRLKSLEHYRLNKRMGKWIELSEKGDTTNVEQY